jgi:hypothetical protein
LTSLPVYALFFFKAPSGIISSIVFLLINFFLGEGGVRTLGKSHGLPRIPSVCVRGMEGWGEEADGV